MVSESHANYPVKAMELPHKVAYFAL